MSCAGKIIFSLFLFIQVFAQKPVVEKIEPPNWWTGMKYNSLQLMVYGKNLDNISASINSSEIKILSVEKTENPDYAFINIEIGNNAVPGNYKLIFEKKEGKAEKSFPLFEKEKSKRNQGFSSEDVIYLIMPDRFANGDISNDNAKGFIDSLNRKNQDGRHGGDIKGIIDNLDYLKNLGVTALWITPLVVNNTPMSYHGYGATDFYNIDPRLGTNNLYKDLVIEAHKRDIKIIIDHVSNHFHKNHRWIESLPVKSWIHGSVENHLQPDHHKMVFADPYRDSSSIKKVSEGWFTNYLADLNQSDPFVKKYIIQNTIWWIEFSGLDGVREDTYPYSDQKFLSEWAEIILNEYPCINIVGEVWTGEPAFLSVFQKGNNARGFDSNLPSVTDFGMRDSYYDFLTGKGNLTRIYETLTKDYLYQDPEKLVTFIDNHDIARGLFYAGGNSAKMKIALTLLLTTRGIPQLLYGTEVNYAGGESHGTLRFDFPGGFLGDSVNYFSGRNLSPEQNDYFNYLKNLLSLRKKYKALSAGNIIHFPPVDGIYVYFKRSGDEEFVIIINEKHESRNFDPGLYNKFLFGKTLINIFSGDRQNSDLILNLPAESSLIFKIE